MKSLYFLLLFVLVVCADNYTLYVSQPPVHGTIKLVDATTVKYEHTDTLIDRVHIGLDSIELFAVDDAGNVDSGKIHILIIPKPDENPFNIELFSINNPLDIVGTNVKKLSENFTKRFPDIRAFSYGTNGMAFVVVAGRDVDPSSFVGRMVIFDAVGNMIANDIFFEWVPSATINDSYSGAGIAIWDGHNRSGRVVGSSAYVAYIEITISGYAPDVDSLIPPKGFEKYYESIKDDFDMDLDKIKFHGTFNKVIGVRIH